MHLNSALSMHCLLLSSCPHPRIHAHLHHEGVSSSRLQLRDGGRGVAVGDDIGEADGLTRAGVHLCDIDYVKVGGWALGGLPGGGGFAMGW